VTRQEVQIGANTFYIRRFDAFLALEILGDLQQRLLGPVLAVVDAKEESQTGAFMAGLEKLSTSMDGKTLRALADRLLDPEFVSVSIDGKDAVKLSGTAKLTAFTSAADVVELCVASIRFNYADFIERWRPLISSAASRLPSSQQAA
jgi:hypothetical protein